MTVIAAEANFVVSARLLALTVTTVLAFTACAVKTPKDETVPAEADQLTAGVEAPVTVAAN
jgi:hypothetical protein